MKTPPAKTRSKKNAKASPTPDAPPLPIAKILNDPKPLVLPRHGGGVAESLPRDLWPSPSPVELATVTAACGWMNQSDGPSLAMELLWSCAEVIHESRESAVKYVESINLKNEWTAAELRKVCGFDYRNLPDRISRPDFLKYFKVSGRLQVNGKDLREWDVVNHWLCLPDGMGMTERDLNAWHAKHKKGFDCTSFTFEERWEFLAVMVARFDEWRKETARRNNPGVKNLKRGEDFP